MQIDCPTASLQLCPVMLTFHLRVAPEQIADEHETQPWSR